MATGVNYDEVVPATTIPEFVARYQKDPWLQESMKNDPVKTIAAVLRPLDTDNWIYRGVVIALGLTVVLAVAGAITLSLMGKPTPEVITALGSAAVGALAGLLAPSPANK
jgi:hypothetical protein